MVLLLTSVREERANGASFAELALPLFDSLYNFARWLAQDRSEAEDLVQETYAKALRAFGSFEQGTNFRAWMFRILRNTFLNSRTALAAARTVPIEEDEYASVPPSAQETPESILLNLADREAIRQAIEELPVGFREVLLLSDVEELSYREIAEALAIPIGTVMSRLARARGELRKSLQGKLTRA
ncbi:MAG TPA: sigma-70 family RNA polymerase sigma factor [Candidatus Acidoferrales bacterium]|nr:sigma-70 family RNA polymerase sigma factor [Candidatus Acidoferrales bacterium]